MRALAFALVGAAALAGPVRGEDGRGPATAAEPGREDAAPVLGLGEYAVHGWDPGGGLIGALDPWPEDDAPPPGMDEEALRGWLRETLGSAHGAALAADLRRRVVVEAEVTGEVGDGPASWTATLVARPGRRAAAARVRDLDLLAEYDPELACDNTLDGSRPSVIGDPQVRRVHDGHAVDVRAFPLGDGSVVALEAIVQWGRFREPVPSVPTGAKHLGDVDLPRYLGGIAVLSGTVAAGASLEARVGSGDAAVRIRLTPRFEGEAAPDGEGAAVRRLHAGLVALPPWIPGRRAFEGWLQPYGRPFPFLGEGLAAVAPDTLAGLLWERADLEDLQVDRWGRVWASGDASRWGAIRAVCDPLLAEASRTVTLEVRAFAGPAEVARVEVPSLLGRGALARFGEDRACLWDSDPEVG